MNAKFLALLAALLGVAQVAFGYECKDMGAETVMYDPACASGGLGCNAGGQGQNCRFCGFGVFTWPCTNGGTGTGTSTQAPATGGPTTAQPNQPGSVTFKVINNCRQTLWIGIQGRSLNNPNWKLPYNGGFALPAGQTKDVYMPKDLSASRFWGRTNCEVRNGQFECETGNCGPWLECAWDGIQRGGATPATLAEFTLNGWGNQDYYDVSLVDGYNLPVTIRPRTPDYSQSGQYWCTIPSCTRDLNEICPPELQKKNSKGQVVGCLSACERFNTDQYCCRGAHDQPHTCKSSDWPVNYPLTFKTACPTAYSYAYDDTTSTFFCKNTDYDIQFC